MKEAIYFLPCKSEDLSIYFRQACIIPRKYFPGNNSNNDVCDKLILISTHKDYYGFDCLIKVVLTEEEKLQFYEVADNPNLFLFYKPIPVTRIKNVYFNSQERKDIVTTTININTAFIPPILNFIKIEQEIKNSPKPIISDTEQLSDLSSNIRRFDQVLGAFSLMKLSTEGNMNYSENYFSNLSYFNVLIKEEAKRASIFNSEKMYFTDTELLKKIFPNLNKILTEEDIVKCANSDRQPVMKNQFTGQIEIDKLTGAPYILSILFSYGIGDDGKGLKADSLITSNFQSGIKKEYSELVALCYGLYKGYYIFSKSYKVTDKEAFIKFKLNSKLDYYTVETIYQYAFYNKRDSSTFPYLDWCPSLPERKVRSKSQYKILDEVVIAKKKPLPGSPEYLEAFLKNNKTTLILNDFINKIISYVSSDFENEVDEIKEELEQVKLEAEQTKAGFDVEKWSLQQTVENQSKEIESLRDKLAEAVKVPSENSSSESLTNNLLQEESKDNVKVIIKANDQLSSQNEVMRNLLNKIHSKKDTTKSLKKEIEFAINQNLFE